MYLSMYVEFRSILDPLITFFTICWFIFVIESYMIVQRVSTFTHFTTHISYHFIGGYLNGWVLIRFAWISRPSLSIWESSRILNLSWNLNIMLLYHLFTSIMGNWRKLDALLFDRLSTYRFVDLDLCSWADFYCILNFIIFPLP